MAGEENSEIPVSPLNDLVSNLGHMRVRYRKYAPDDPMKQTLVSLMI